MPKQWTIYSSLGEYLASVKVGEHAGMLLSCLDDPGATIRLGRGRQIAWTDGVDGNAADSFDEVAFHLADWVDANVPAPTFVCQCCNKVFPATLDADGLWYRYHGGHFALEA